MHFRNRTFHPFGFPAGRVSAWITIALLWVYVTPVASSAAELTLTWSDNSNNESGFKIERSLDGQSFSQIATVGANLVSYTNTGLADSTSYWYRVRAYNTAGNSGYSNVGSAQTSGGDEPPPSVNTAPTITSISNQTINEDGTTGSIAFKVTDTESANGSLTLSATSSNTALIPIDRILFGGASTDRTVQVIPANNRSGVATVAVTVSDGALIASRAFQVTVNPVNDVPSLDGIPDQTVEQGGSTGPIGFRIFDAETPSGDLALTRTSSNVGLVPLSGIVFGGSKLNRSVTVSPIASLSGTADITVAVNDGQATSSRTFRVTVVGDSQPPPPVNTAPTISNIPNKTIIQGSDTGPIGFSVGDAETPAGSLAFSLGSSNTTLVSRSGISLGGSGSNRSISVTPDPNQSGETTIYVRVSDGQLEATDTFRLRVIPLDAVTVGLTAPTDGAQFSVGSSVNITALASDPARTSRVEFFSGSSKLGQDSSSPYSHTWSEPGVGSHTLKARVVETSGAIRDSSPVTITVSEVISLTVSMVSPSADESIVLGEALALEAVVDGPASAIKRVDFYVDATRIKQEFNPPYAATWTPAEPGSYTLKARVISSTNLTSDSPVRMVSVASPAVTVSLVSPGAQASYAFAESITVAALVSDIATTARVDFFDGDSKINSAYYSPYEFSWTPETSGTHSIWARVHDTVGNARTSASAEITVEPPPDLRVVLEDPQAGTSFVVGEKTTLRASVEAPVTSIDRVEFHRGSTKLGQDSTAPFSLDWTATPTGDHDLRARVISTGGLGFDSQIARISVLDVPLTVRLTAPANGQIFEIGESIMLAASVSDESRTDRVEFYAENTKLGEDASAPYTLDWTPSRAGSQVVFSRVVEKGGNTRDSAMIVITIEDALPLNVSIASPSDGTVMRIGETVTVSAAIDVASDNVSRVDFDGGSARIKTVWVDPYEFEWTPTAVGSYSIRARARNTAGTRYDSARVTVEVRHPIIQAELTRPADGAVYTLGQAVHLEASVSDPERTDSVGFLVDGDAVWEDYEAPFSFSWQKPTAGSYNISVRVVDLDGESFFSETVSITVNDPLLTVTLIDPPNGAHIAKSGVLTIEAIPSDISRTSIVEFLVDNVAIGVVTDPPFRMVWVGEEEGQHTIQVRAYDRDGNGWLSKTAVITVNPLTGPMPGVFRGAFADLGDGTVTGGFAIHVTAQGSIAFLGYDESSGTGFVSSSVALTGNGGFAIEGEGPSGPVILTARIGPDTIEGRVDDLNLVLSGEWVAGGGQSSFYRLVGVQSMNTEVYLVTGPQDRAFVGSQQNGFFRGHESVPLSMDSGAYISSEWLGLEVNLDFDDGVGRGFMDSPDGGVWVAGLSRDVPAEQRLENLSTRGFINPGNSVMIVGFVTTGDGPKQVLIRGVGPGLGDFGLSAAMRDPTLELRRGAETIGFNQRWYAEGNGQTIEIISARVGAFTLDRNSTDATLLTEVSPGVYTAIVRDALRLGGDTLVEIYDVDEDTPILADLSSLSTRGPVGSGKNLIGGFVISGNMPKRVLIRGVGPALVDFGVVDALASARLVLTHRVAGDEITIGDNLGWSSSPQASLIAEVAATVGAFPLDPNSLDSALLLWLEPGVYTFIVQPGSAGMSGTALVEVYSVD